MELASWFLVLAEEMKKIEVSSRYQILVSLLPSILLDFFSGCESKFFT